MTPTVVEPPVAPVSVEPTEPVADRTPEVTSADETATTTTSTTRKVLGAILGTVGAGALMGM